MRSFTRIRCFFLFRLVVANLFEVGFVFFFLQIPAVGTSTQLSLALSMDGGRRRVGSLTLTVFARAPRVVAAKFSGTAAEIIVNFDKEVKFDGEESCGVFFEAVTVAKLGQGPECRLKTSQQLEITLGNGASIEVNDRLAFKENVFKARGQQFSRYLNGSFTVDFPDVQLKPAPVITGKGTPSF